MLELWGPDSCKTDTLQEDLSLLLHYKEHKEMADM